MSSDFAGGKLLDGISMYLPFDRLLSGTVWPRESMNAPAMNPYVSPSLAVPLAWCCCLYGLS